jgi:hypothetical protein
MKTFRRDEIENKHGQYIAYWSKQNGNTELEKYKKFIQKWNIDSKSKLTTTEHVVKDNNGNDITCYISQEEGPDGHALVCFNNLGETILNTNDCYSNDIDSIIESLSDYGKL